MTSRKLFLLLACLGALGCAAPARAAGLAEPLDRPAVMVRNPQQVGMLGAAAAGSRLVAVGERGIILLSDDQGGHWRQAKVPVSTNLNAVAFPTPRLGWAVGHAGIVLHTEDGGETWVRQLDGIQAAKLVLDSSPREDAAAPFRARQARRLVEEGPDKPFLDLFFPSATEGFVIGAFGLAFHTLDGGKSWTSLTLELPNPQGHHLYSVRGGGGAIYMAGEQGLALRSDDGGATFVELSPPYRGSYFSVAADQAGNVVLAGLRGNVVHSADRGKTWRALEMPVPVSVTATVLTPEGQVLMVNQAGMILVADMAAPKPTPLPFGPLPPPAGLIALGDGRILLTTPRGMRLLPERSSSAPGLATKQP
jgi:photosystem II stability/assembly factor-like uncharacterized protein